jgi:hypothetical protein
MAGTPARAFRRVERRVARPLERLVESEGAIDAIVRLAGVQAGVQRRAERAITAYLHLWHLPSLTDIRRLSQQMSYLERRVRELSREAAEPPAEQGSRDGRAA